jgi:hypothetical protein
MTVSASASGARVEVRSERGPLLSSAVGSVSLGLLLFVVVVSSIVEAAVVFSVALVAAWVLLPAVVGFRNTLDAGCRFMVVALGTAVVTALAHHGVGSLLP